MDYSKTAVEKRRRKASITKVGLIGLPVLAIVGLTFWIMMSRSGTAMYRQFFGKPATPCVQMLHHQEQGFDDCCAWMNFRTCPAEVVRIFKNIEQQELQRLVDASGQYADCSEPARLVSAI